MWVKFEQWDNQKKWAKNKKIKRAKIRKEKNILADRYIEHIMQAEFKSEFIFKHQQNDVKQERYPVSSFFTIKCFSKG